MRVSLHASHCLLSKHYEAKRCSCSLVGEVNIVVDKNRVDGTRVRLAEVEVGDETGVVWLRARDEQIDLLQQVSSRSGAVVLRNCTLELYQGKHIRLAITKWGKLSTYPDQIASTPPPPSKINTDRNFSLIDLSVVASEMVAFAQVDSYHTAVEAENQPGSVMNRAQPYHSAASMSRRGRRPQQMGKPASAPAPMGLHYGEQGMASPLSYPSAMHSYASNYSYPPGQQEALSSGQQPMMSTTQQMLFQQQYEMQHRQMQQMYQSPQDRLSSSSPMISPGVAPNVSFDSTFSSGGDVPMHTANPFTMQSQVSSQQKSPSQPPDASGTMNPRAATFDPYRKPYGK